MNKDTIALKERIIAWVDELDRPYVIPMICDLENAIHQHSFDCGYETGYDEGWIDGHEMGSYSSD